VGRLDPTVDTLLVLGELVKVELRCRRERFDDVFQRVLVDPRPQVEELDRDLGVSEELRADVALQQVLGHRVVVREVAVVDQRLVEADKGMRAAGMPHAALRRVALVGDPGVGAEVVELVVLDDLLGVAHDLEHEQVAPVREHERLLFAEGGVERLVQTYGVAIDELVLDVARRKIAEAVLLGEGLQGIGLHAHQVAVDVGRSDLQARHVAVIVHGRHADGESDVEDGLDAFAL
jgi:hypothetical protein